MNSLDKAVERVLAWTADRQKDRAEVLDLLEQLIQDCQQAVQVWREYLNAPGAPGDAFTLVSWMGSQPVKALHDISLEARERILRLCRLADPEVARFVIYDDDLIELAFRAVKPNETGPDAARAAVEVMGERIKHLQGLAGRIRATPPRPAMKRAAPPAGKPAAKAAKKPGPKSVKKKPARPAPKKKKK